MSENFTYCPICQLPLKAISISPELHVSMCMTRCDEGESEDCPKGVHCLSTDVFHYRDYSHKLLAAYRSSADFVPPDEEIKPSPKKRKTPKKNLKRASPRKTRTPIKSGQKNTKNTSDSESDVETFVQAKKPRRNLRFSEKKESSEKDSEKRPLRCTNENNSKPNQGQNKLVNKNFEHKLTIVNVKLNEDREIAFNNARATSPLSSLSITTTSTSKVDDSEFDSETTVESNKNVTSPASKVVLKEPVLKFSKKDDYAKTTTKEKSLVKDSKIPNNPLKSDDEQGSIGPVKDSKISNNPIMFDDDQGSIGPVKDSKIPNNPIKSDDEQGSVGSVVMNESNNSLTKDDFDDMIPGSMVDKDLLQALERQIVTSPSTIQTASEYNGTADSASSLTDDNVSEDKESILDDSPSSPEVTITPKTRKPTAVLSSSSDSDLPLATLIRNKHIDKVHENNNEVKGKLRSGKPLKDKNNDDRDKAGRVLRSPSYIEVKGKVKAGKVLRSPNKAPVYLNGSTLKLNSMKNEIKALSEKDSDSGKSSGSKDSSFIPSNANSSCRSSDSAFSAESTDNLTASSASSTYTSSEENTSEGRASDPSYSGDSDITSRPKKLYNSPKKLYKQNNHLVTSLSHSDSSSSDISIREKLIFGKKKTPPSEKDVKESKPRKQNSTMVQNNTSDSDEKKEWKTLLSKMRNGCFPSDLKIDSEDSLTVVSSCSSSDTSHTSTILPPRQCPFYKRIPDTPFVVDAFQYWNIPGVNIYFLSHFHSDHYIGLKKSFSHPIYCTKITANLVRMKLRVDEKWLRTLELNQPQIIRGVEVTALEANHCPGSVMLLFCLTNGRSYLHVGDFRATQSMTLYPALQRISISKLFLDTTYCSPQYCFPSQEEVIGKVIDIIRDQVKSHPRTLVVCGSYTIGKEKVFLGVAEAMNWRVWARPEKQRIFTCLGDARINSRLVTDPRSANVHVLPMGNIQIMSLQQHLKSCTGAFTHVIGVKPTGWELNSKSQNFKVTTRDNITIYGVPYSEHSSFSELRDFVQFVLPEEIVPTVNVGSAASRANMSKHFSDWLKPRTESKEIQRKVSQYFKTSSS